jgi:hypothetical protein
MAPRNLLLQNMHSRHTVMCTETGINSPGALAGQSMKPGHIALQAGSFHGASGDQVTPAQAAAVGRCSPCSCDPHASKFAE